MARLDWNRARPARPSISIVKEEKVHAPRLARRQRWRPPVPKSDLRSLATDAVAAWEAAKREAGR